MKKQNDLNDFNFPIIKGEMKLPRLFSMDEYFQFVQFNLQHTVDHKAYKKHKKELIVDVPFVLK